MSRVTKPTIYAATLSALLLGGPLLAQTNDTSGCTTLAQAAAAGMAARISADDQTIKPPQSVTTLSCLNGFFNGVGLNVITNLLNPGSLLTSVEGQICSAVQSSWQSFIGGAQCGLTVTGFNVGFGGLGGGLLCPKLSFGGGGASIGNIGTGLGGGQSGQYLSGAGIPPTGYTLPTGTSY